MSQQNVLEQHIILREREEDRASGKFQRRVSVAQLFALVQSKRIKFSLNGCLKMNDGGASMCPQTFLPLETPQT